MPTWKREISEIPLWLDTSQSGYPVLKKFDTSLGHWSATGQAPNVISFGAKGDGKTDDTKAFTDALTKSSSSVIEVNDGDYKITSFTIPTGKKLLLSKKSRLIATNNTNVVIMQEGSAIEGGEIVTNGITGFSKAAIYMDAINFPTLNTKTYVTDVHLTGKKSEGYGIHLFNNGSWTGIDWVTVTKVNIYGYNKGIFLQAKRPTANSCWINGNVFDDIVLMYPDYGIYLEATAVFAQSGNEGVVNANYFININAQYAANCVTCFYCEGGVNVYSAQAFDYPVEFIMAPQSESNTVETMFGVGVDNGTKNRIKRIGKYPQPEMIQLGHFKNPSFQGLQDDFLAYADKRHTVTQTLGPVPTFGKLRDLFSYDSMDGEERRRDNYVTWSNTQSNPVVILIEFPYPIHFWEMVQVNFAWDVAKKVKIEMYSTQWNMWMTMEDRQANTQSVVINSSIQPIMFVDKIRFTFSSDTDFSVNKIAAFNSKYIGNTFVTKSGGKIYGGLSLEGNLDLGGGNAVLYSKFLSLMPTTPESVYNGSIFIDINDNLLKFKSTSAGIYTINTTLESS